MVKIRQGAGTLKKKITKKTIKVGLNRWKAIYRI